MKIQSKEEIWSAQIDITHEKEVGLALYGEKNSLLGFCKFRICEDSVTGQLKTLYKDVDAVDKFTVSLLYEFLIEIFDLLKNFTRMLETNDVLEFFDNDLDKYAIITEQPKMRDLKKKTKLKKVFIVLRENCSMDMAVQTTENNDIFSIRRKIRSGIDHEGCYTTNIYTTFSCVKLGSSAYLENFEEKLKLYDEAFINAISVLGRTTDFDPEETEYVEEENYMPKDEEVSEYSLLQEKEMTIAKIKEREDNYVYPTDTKQFSIWMNEKTGIILGVCKPDPEYDNLDVFSVNGKLLGEALCSLS